MWPKYIHNFKTMIKNPQVITYIAKPYRPIKKHKPITIWYCEWQYLYTYEYCDFNTCKCMETDIITKKDLENEHDTVL